jgi:hypothetical protein
MQSKNSNDMAADNWLTNYLNGNVKFNSIHDEIDLWHTGTTDLAQSINEYLGLTSEEYAMFVDNEKKFKEYLKNTYKK